MTMTIDTIASLEPLREQARHNKLRELAVYVPDEDDISFADDSYVFLADAREAKWWEVLNFQRFAAQLLGGEVFVMKRGSVDNVESVKANTNAIPVLN